MLHAFSNYGSETPLLYLSIMCSEEIQTGEEPVFLLNLLDEEPVKDLLRPVDGETLAGNGYTLVEKIRD